MFKNLEEAAVAVDEMFNVAFQNAGCMCLPLILLASLFNYILNSDHW
jgi:hypothetical protein